jgi:tetratricopeptide (TPR) repeat protein
MDERNQAGEKVPTAERPSPAPPRPKPGRRGLRLGLTLAAIAAAAAAVLAAWKPPLRWGEPTLARAEDLLEQKRYADAEAEAEAVLEREPGDTGALVALARAKIGRGDLAGGAEALEKVPEWSRRKPVARYFQAKATLDLGRGREAERLFEAAASGNSPLRTSAYIELMALYAMEERYEDFRRVLWELYPKVPESERLDVLTLGMRGKFEQVEAQKNAASLQKLLAADPADARARAGLAAAYMHEDRLPKAADELRRALADAPDDPEIHEKYFRVLHKMGDIPALLEAVEARPAGSDERADTQKFVGIAAQERGDLAAAEAAFDRAVRLDPLEPEYHHRLSQVLTARGETSRAAEEARRRNELNEADDALQKAWQTFIVAYEREPGRIAPALVDGMARACTARGLTREADAWAREARRLETADTPRQP